MPVLRLFAAAREAAGSARERLPGSTVEEVLAHAVGQFGDDFAAVVDTSRVWVNGIEVDPTTAVDDDDEIAVLPPVSGG